MAERSPTIEIDRAAWEQLSKLVLDTHESILKMEPRGDPDVERRVMFTRGGAFPLLSGLVQYIEGKRRRVDVGGSGQ